MTGMLRRLIRGLGFDIVRYRPPSHGPLLPDDLSERDREILRRIVGYTMTGIDRQVALVSAVRYLTQRGLEGCIVECGVWRGGILIVDDYGHWAGARKAVDEFLAGQSHAYYLHRIDYTGRLLIKE